MNEANTYQISDKEVVEAAKDMAKQAQETLDTLKGYKVITNDGQWYGAAIHCSHTVEDLPNDALKAILGSLRKELPFEGEVGEIIDIVKDRQPYPYADPLCDFNSGDIGLKVYIPDFIMWLKHINEETFSRRWL